jgi:hypothetical protein
MAVRIAWFVAIWLPFFVLWVVLFRTWGGESVGESVAGAAGAIGAAALLGLGVRRYCALQPWPDRLDPGFYLRHLTVASGFAATWVLAVYAWEGMIHGGGLLESLRHSPRDLGWQVVMGLWLYGMMAGVVYAVDAQERIVEQERRAAEAEAAVMRARFEALSNRVHPHFLFNALHTVSALTRYDPPRAEEAVERLGDMLRYTLEDRSVDLVPLRVEWEFVRRYVEFERLRFEDRLRFDAEIEPQALGCAVPPFLVQTLVENAVRHSVSVRPEGGWIGIGARVIDGGLVVRVEDDGPGRDWGPMGDGRLGTGLETLRERIAVAFGERAAVAVEPGAEKGFRVTVTIPRVEATPG